MVSPVGPSPTAQSNRDYPVSHSEHSGGTSPSNGGSASEHRRQGKEPSLSDWVKDMFSGIFNSNGQPAKFVKEGSTMSPMEYK